MGFYGLVWRQACVRRQLTREQLVGRLRRPAGRRRWFWEPGKWKGMWSVSVRVERRS